jgi:carbamoyl-phosphate synthase large subunit
LEEGIALIEKLGFPLMVRPSFVIGGVAMHVATRFEDCVKILEMAFSAEPDQSVMIDRFLPGKEFEVDAVCDGKDILIPGIFEHLDPAGIHSGDSISIFPDISLNQRQRQEIVDITRKLSEALDVHGLLNIQFVLSSGTLYVIEANPRASRTVPIGSKLTGIPLVDLSVGVALGERLVNSSWGTGLYLYTGPFGVKAPVFSTEKLPGIDSRLGPQMQSTGESLGVADTVSDALFDALQGADLSIPEKGRVLFSVRDDVKDRVYPVASMLSALGWDIDATPGTATLLKRWGLPVNPIKKDDSLFEGVRNGRWQLIVNIPGLFIEPLTDGAKIRKAALDGSIVCLHSLETAAAVASAAIARKK